MDRRNTQRILQRIKVRANAARRNSGAANKKLPKWIGWAVAIAIVFALCAFAFASTGLRKSESLLPQAVNGYNANRAALPAATAAPADASGQRFAFSADAPDQSSSAGEARKNTGAAGTGSNPAQP